ncbi:hypothetical protein ACQKNX_02225 [Lysinibacillus sp. NPDC093712]|uniref:hypothetical protein n=1 Tax=Lysinibacillus sp. NPDC093712 TaxID=3390579 RepID=UPI003D085C3B
MFKHTKTWLAKKLDVKRTTQSINRRITPEETSEQEAIAEYKDLLLKQEYKICELEGEITSLKISNSICEVRIEAYEAQQSNSILVDIQQLFANQTNKGIRKYGESVRADNLTQVEWCQHALEEHADSMVYLMALKKSLEESESNGFKTS